MQQKRNFGRRAANDEPRRTALPLIVKRLRTDEPAPAAVVVAPPAADEVPNVDRELEEWKAARKKQRRHFREPWRTLSIATTVGFGASFWLLPDAVADVVQYVTGALALASFFTGLRGYWRRTPKSAPEKVGSTG
ncbi:MAG TPA: hypothetical protein VKT24_05715 [Rhizomicrobium sp.]|nr:hypothetical protein [Rhizomicrobium sp.]